MKIARLWILIAAAMLFAACGGNDGGGGGGTATQQAETSFDDFVQQLITCVGGALGNEAAIRVEKDQTFTCNCESSGTIVATISDDQQDVTVNINECTTADGNTYNGTANSTDGGTTINGTMGQFGLCTNGTATNVDGNNCSGAVSVTCSGQTINCTVVDSTTEEDECDLSC